MARFDWPEEPVGHPVLFDGGGVLDYPVKLDAARLRLDLYVVVILWKEISPGVATR